MTPASSGPRGAGRRPAAWRRAALAALLAVAVAAPLAAQDARPPDPRQRVPLPPAARDTVLAEMRAMLASIDGVLRGLAAGDQGAAEQAARASGLATAAEVDPAIKRALPPAFLQLGMQTHQGFDRLADRLRAGVPRDAALAGLAEVTARCVACHAAYRLDAGP
jgi:hypothetical protein